MGPPVVWIVMGLGRGKGALGSGSPCRIGPPCARFRTFREQPRLVRAHPPQRSRRSSPACRASSSPAYLWIGCADSRVPANEIVDLAAGRALRPSQRRQRRRAQRPQLPVRDAVRRRRAARSSTSSSAATTAAAAFPTALQNERVGLADNWLRHVQDVHAKHEAQRRQGCRHAASASTGSAS